MTKLEEVIENPHDHDVLSGRGNFVNYHAGNEYFRMMVRKYKVAYVACPKPQKGKFSKMIYDEIRLRDPPGRFLKQDDTTKLWYDIGEKKALDKTRQALREGAPDIQKELTTDPSEYVDDENEEVNNDGGCISLFQRVENTVTTSTSAENLATPSMDNYLKLWQSASYESSNNHLLRGSHCNNNSLNRDIDTNLLENARLGALLCSEDVISDQTRDVFALKSQLVQAHSVQDVENYEQKSVALLQINTYDGHNGLGLVAPQDIVSNTKENIKQNFHQEDQLQLRLRQQQLEEERFRQVQQQYQLEQQLHLLQQQRLQQQHHHQQQQQQQQHRMHQFINHAQPQQQQQQQQHRMNQCNNHVPPQRTTSLQLAQSRPTTAVMRTCSDSKTSSDSRLFHHIAKKITVNTPDTTINGNQVDLYEPRPLDPHYVERHRNGLISESPDSPTNYETEDVGPLPILRSGTFRDNSCSSLVVDNVFSSPNGMKKLNHDHAAQPIGKSSHRLPVGLPAYMTGNNSGTMSSIDDFGNEDSSEDDDGQQLSMKFSNSMRVSYHGPKYMPKTSYHGSTINSSIHENDFGKGMSEHSIIPGTSTLQMSVATIEGTSSIAHLMTESEMSFASVFDDGERTAV